MRNARPSTRPRKRFAGSRQSRSRSQRLSSRTTSSRSTRCWSASDSESREPPAPRPERRCNRAADRMFRRLFGSGARARVFLRPGATLSTEVLRAHRARHTPALRERRAGQTTNFIVFSDGTANGDAAAQAMLASAEGDFQATQQWFGGLTPPNLPFYVYADPNAGGAYHLSCAGTDVHVLSDSALAPGFLTAEIVEVFEDAINHGWDCGFTNGKSLSWDMPYGRVTELAGDLMMTVHYRC